MTQLYRLLTGEDGSAFCHKVTLALSKGWRLYGEAQYVFDPDSQKMRRRTMNEQIEYWALF